MSLLFYFFVFNYIYLQYNNIINLILFFVIIKINFPHASFHFNSLQHKIAQKTCSNIACYNNIAEILQRYKCKFYTVWCWLMLPVLRSDKNVYISKFFFLMIFTDFYSISTHFGLSNCLTSKLPRYKCLSLKFKIGLSWFIHLK